MHHLNLEFDGDEDDSLVLVPNVLASVCRYRPAAYLARDTKTKQLSIMYEILRGWKMPGMYERR